MSSSRAFSLFSPFCFGSILLDQNKKQPYMCHIYVFVLIFARVVFYVCVFIAFVLYRLYPDIRVYLEITRSYIVAYMSFIGK